MSSAMDGGMVAQLQWAMVAAMGDSGCHDGGRQQRRHDCDGRQRLRCNGRWNSGAIVMAIAMNSGGGNRRQQWWRHRDGGWWLRRNGWCDGGTIAMCSVAIAMDGGGGNGQRRRDGSTMGDCDGAGTIAMVDGGSGAMAGGMTA